MNNPIILQLPSVGSEAWLASIESMFPCKREADTLYYDNELGHGFISLEEIQKGLVYAFVDLYPKYPINYLRKSKRGDNRYTLVISVDNSSFTLSSEDQKTTYFKSHSPVAFLMGPSSSFLFNSEPDTHQSYLLIFLEDEWVAENLLDDNNSFPIDKLMVDSAPVKLFEEDKGEYQEFVNTVLLNKGKSKLLKLAVFVQFISNFFRRLSINDKKTLKTIEQVDAERIYSICKQIEVNIAMMPPIPNLAKKSGMSLSKFKYTFRQLIGMNPYEYHMTVKMEYAKSLIIGSNKTISEVGHLCGYNNLSHFARVFKKYHGKLPSSLR
jgi:AraC-like DNA-binding protein